MRETPLSNCEKDFILQAIKQNNRLDGRKNDEFRKINISFGNDWGSALVSLGETKVLAQVSCELGLPKATRPNEGIMYINVDLGPMAAPHFEAGRSSELLVQINRTLERTFKDSKCVDLESLCVMAEEKVWVLRVDLNVLNHEGNLIDCCSIAALSALGHFRRPDVSIIDNDVRIHTFAEKDPIPLVLHHYPICVTYCSYEEGNTCVVDPNCLEERCATSTLIFGLNSFRELCCLNLGGSTLTSTHLLLQCAQRAAKHAQFVVDKVKKLLEEDFEEREKGTVISFSESLCKPSISSSEDRLLIKLRNFTLKDKSHEVRNFQIKEENADGKSDGETKTSDNEQEQRHQKMKGKKNKKDKALKKASAMKASMKPAENLQSWLPEADESEDEDSKDPSSDAPPRSNDFREKSETEKLEKNSKKKRNKNKNKAHSRNSSERNTPMDADSEEEDKTMIL